MPYQSFEELEVWKRACRLPRGFTKHCANVATLA